MAEFGAFTELTFVNGTTPAISATNLNEMQRTINLFDDELARSQSYNFNQYKEYYWQKNCKLIHDGQILSGWAADASTSVTADTTNFLVGVQSIRMTETDNVAGWIGVAKTITALNLDTFNDGLVASGSSHIMWCFYISDVTKFTWCGFKLGTDNSNNYSIIYAAASLRTGWNCVFERKENFTQAGSPNWNNITYIRFEAITPINSINAYISLQKVMMYRVDPYSSSYYTPWQKYLTGSGYEYSGPEILIDTWAYYYDPVIHALGIMCLDTRSVSNNERSLVVYTSIFNFISKFEFYCKSAGSSPSICWWVNTTNYIEAYISSNTLYLDFMQDGASTSYSVALTNNLVLNERYQIMFEKENLTVRVILYKDAETVKKLEYETSIPIQLTPSDMSGILCLGFRGTGCNGFLTNYEVGNRMISWDSWDIPRVFWKTAAQSISNSTVFTAVTEMFVDLPPNGIFFVKAYISAFDSVDTADIKFQWVTTGDVTQLIGRHVWTMPSNITTPLDANAKCTVYDLATTNVLGLDGTASETLNTESLLVYTGNTGGRLQLNFAQNAAIVTNTSVDDQTFMIVWKLKK